MAELTNLTFEQWIAHAFDHPVVSGQPEWYWDDDLDFWAAEPRQATDYLTRLFTGGDELLRPFSNDQIAHGLNYLVNTSVGMHPDLSNWSVPATERAALWDAVFRLFRDVLRPRALPVLGHLSEHGCSDPLTMRTYMWWEGFPATSTPGDPDQAMLVAAEMRCLENVLGLDSVACAEAALHGLGHWAGDPTGGPLAVAIIDAFLASARSARPELLAYARAARSGCIL
ncbi:MAG: hypothetical protein ABIO69_04360 [Sphingomicrobium sp.]